mmetsp:Transcript_98329/g.234046  ORF Transcript_98329/g.234046 Transcript_98329/m.234046 type:complete len:246 (-) Transcript_98329:1886-2623(-)
MGELGVLHIGRSLAGLRDALEAGGRKDLGPAFQGLHAGAIPAPALGRAALARHHGLALQAAAALPVPHLRRLARLRQALEVRWTQYSSCAGQLGCVRLEACHALGAAPPTMGDQGLALAGGGLHARPRVGHVIDAVRHLAGVRQALEGLWGQPLSRARQDVMSWSIARQALRRALAAMLDAGALFAGALCGRVFHLGRGAGLRHAAEGLGAEDPQAALQAAVRRVPFGTARCAGGTRGDGVALLA